MYKNFGEIDTKKHQTMLPFVENFFMKHKFGAALKMLIGSESVQAREFVESAFGRLRSLNYARLIPGQSSSEENSMKGSESFTTYQQQGDKGQGFEISDGEGESNSIGLQFRGGYSILEKYAKTLTESDELFWKNLTNLIIETIAQKLGLPAPEKIKWDGIELLKKVGVQSLRIAEALYIESGLATPTDNDKENDRINDSQPIPKGVQTSLLEIKKASQDLLKQTDTILGALMIVAAFFSEKEKESILTNQTENEMNKSKGNTGYAADGSVNGSEQLALAESVLDAGKAEEIKTLFSTAESAMEAWAMLATSLGRPSFIKSEFEKICFLDNDTTDTQACDLIFNPCCHVVLL